MTYVMLAFWLLVMMFTAQGVYRLWTGMVQPRWVNAALIPGTLLAQLGYVTGTLLTGGTVSDVTLFGDQDGQPRQGGSTGRRWPMLGTTVAAVAPLVLCAAGIGLAVKYLGGTAIHPLFTESLSKAFPSTVGSFWGLLRDLVGLTEQTLGGLFSVNLLNWRTFLFVYLLICLSVRLGPLPNHSRPAIIAIGLVTVVAAICGSVFAGARAYLETIWLMLSLVVGVLMLLLVISLLIRGGIALARIVAGKA